MNSLRLMLPASALAFALIAGPAHSDAEAKTYCVQYAACPAGGIAKATLTEAVNGPQGADSAPDADVVRIGAGTFQLPALTADERVDIVGAGMGATTLVLSAGAQNGLQLANGSSSVSDLTVRATASPTYSGVRLQHGADASRVEVVSSDDSLKSVSGFFAEDEGTVLDHVRTDLGPTPSGEAAGFSDGGEVRDSDLVGGIGIVPGRGATPTKILRSTVRASIGLDAIGRSAVARNVVILPHPRDHDVFQSAVEVTAGNSGEDASLVASHLTLVGPGDDGTGLQSRTTNLSGAGTASLDVTNSIIRGFATSVYRNGRTAAQKADLNVSYSAYDPSRVTSQGGGTFTSGSGNIANPDPRFVDAAGGDYRLRYDSQLIDSGSAAGQGSDAEGDRGGAPRVRDGNGNGAVQRDMGAYEYQRVAPTAAFAIDSPGPLMGTPVAFTSAATDPDGDALQHEWSFGDGAAATTANVTHAYAHAGTYSATLKVSDPTGLASTASKPIQVAAQPTGGVGIGGGGGGVTAADTTRPVLSALKLSRSRLRTAAKGRVKPGARVSFSLSEAGKVTLTVQRRAGRRWVSVRGSIVRTARKGANRLAFSGSLGGRKLRPGAYRLTAVAVDAAHNRSGAQSKRFAVIR